MEQMSLAPTPKERIIEEIRAALSCTLQSYWLTLDFISFKRRKSFLSVMFNKSMLVFRVTLTPSPYFSIPVAVFQQDEISNGNLKFDKEKKFVNIPFRGPEDIDKHSQLLQRALKTIIERVPKEFDCCHLYMECSDAKKCVYPDKAVSLTCGYKKILVSGRIFYGKNRNI